MTMFTEPCDGGYLLHPTEGCRACREDKYNAAGNIAVTCTRCPEGKGVASGQGTQESDCKWSELMNVIFPFLR